MLSKLQLATRKHRKNLLVCISQRKMHMYEFEAKHWLYKYGLPMQVGDIAYSPSQARMISETLKYEGFSQ